VELIPVAEIEALKDEAMRQATVNADRINAVLDFPGIEAAFNHALSLKIPPRAKMQRFWEAADKLCKAITPFTACRNKCSYCCNIAATMTETEADILGKYVGRKPKKITQRVDILANIPKYSGVPCPFLKKGKCSVYEVRPLACRIHFNLADTPHFCNTDIPPGESVVPQINNSEIDRAHFQAFGKEVWADIRDFFPTK
jgi:hypothetical protein